MAGFLTFLMPVEFFPESFLKKTKCLFYCPSFLGFFAVKALSIKSHNKKVWEMKKSKKGFVFV